MRISDWSSDVCSSDLAQVHRYFAGHGYASMRLDMRGSGDSGGVQANFGMVQEQDDTLEALKWIAAQLWSDGQVGMFGISWGGFQAIQAAFRSPPELKAIIPASFAPDRYDRSEEHTSELQSLMRISYAVICLK